MLKICKQCTSCKINKNSLRPCIINGGHTILYLTNERSAKCEFFYDSIVQYPNDQRCDKISVNNVNLVI